MIDGLLSMRAVDFLDILLVSFIVYWVLVFIRGTRAVQILFGLLILMLLYVVAKKAGMEIERNYGEADAYLRLPPANPASVLQEAVEEQVATIDYTFKANTRAAVKWLESLPKFKPDN